ncbi:MAG TPA: hypothetical protein VNX29_05365 [Kaistia sp.]|nr:hypothetical protein [Kaistia sp.]
MAKDVLGFVSQAEYGRHRGVSRKTVTDWKRKGMLVLDADGRIDVAMTDLALDERPATYRGGVTSGRKGNDLELPRGQVPEQRALRRPKVPVQRDPVPEDLADDEFDDVPVDLSEFGIELAGGWSLAEASRVKEIFLALKRRQDFLLSEKKLVPIEDVAVQVEAQYSVVRERLLSIPGKLADRLVGMDRAAIDAALKREIKEALSELSGVADGAISIGTAGAQAGGGAAGADATAGSQPGGVV